jgi:hypothetical protein
MAAALTVFRQVAIENARLRDEQVRAEDEAAKAQQKALLGMADTVERDKCVRRDHSEGNRGRGAGGV